MAKRRARRKFNLRKVRILAKLDLGALAAADVISGAFSGVASDTYRVTSIDVSWNWTDIADVNDDYIQFGVAHSDYTAAEIEEALEGTGGIDLGDKIGQERANRLVREIGVFGGPRQLAGSAEFNDGRPMKTKLNWKISIGDTLVLWARNASGVLLVTGSAVGATGVMWVKDGGN